VVIHHWNSPFSIHNSTFTRLKAEEKIKKKNKKTGERNKKKIQKK